jgi:hypothetical protein
VTSVSLGVNYSGLSYTVTIKCMLNINLYMLVSVCLCKTQLNNIGFIIYGFHYKYFAYHFW